MRFMVSILLLLISGTLHSQSQPKSAEAILEEGITLQEEGDYAGAIVLFNQCIYLYPTQAEAYALRAACKEQLHELSSALTDYTISLELLPNQFEVLLKRGALLFRLSLYERARNDFEKLLTLPPGETTTVFYRKSAHSKGTDKIMTAQGFLLPQVFNYLGLIETQLHNCKRGISYADSAIKHNNTEADYYVNRALAKQACQDQTFILDFQRALELNPDHTIALHNLAVESSKTGSYEQAEKQLTAAIQGDSTQSSSFAERGYYRLQRGDFKGALSDYNQAIVLSNTNPEIWFNRGMTKEKLKDFVGAYADYKQAIELQEDFTKAWLNRGNLFSKQGRYREAIEDYSVAITYQADYAIGYYNRALAKHYEKSSDACEDLKQAIALGMKVEKSVKEEICKH